MQVTGQQRLNLATTAATLAGNGTWDTQGINADSFKTLLVSGLADQAGSYVVEFSDDNANWDTYATQSVTASTAFNNTYTIGAQYVRVVYTNGATQQTKFHMRVHGFPI